jgi:hypothetical protein
VVEATVLARQVERKPGSPFLQTVTTLHVDWSHKGSLDGEFDVVLTGGRIGDEVTTLPGAPTFTAGERVVVFVEQKQGDWRLVGLAQGKYTLIEERGTGRDAIVQLRVPEAVAEFDEAAVTLPAVRRYADDFLGLLGDEAEAGLVPTYKQIAGIGPVKDLRFRLDAVAAGQDVDGIWFDPAHNPNARHDAANGWPYGVVTAGSPQISQRPGPTEAPAPPVFDPMGGER